jgi:aconitate hydratase
MAQNVAQKLIDSHLVSGEMKPGTEIGIKIDQTLTQDATGTLVMLELEAMELDRTRAEVSVQYVDHNLLQTDERNADDHMFLYSACRRFGVWYSKAGNGVSHPTHQKRFGIPGKTMVGSDSHTPAAGAIGMLAIGVGGLAVAMAMIGEPLYIEMPEIWGVKLTGELPDWSSAKDVILEMLRRHGVSGGKGRIVEYYGPGLGNLSAMDRHVIANMGTELGATTTVFPSDDEVRRFLESEERGDDWAELVADEGAAYDVDEEIDLSEIEPLIATPSSPGNVVPVREVAGREISQAVIGSSANPGLRDFAVPAMIAEGKHVHPRVSLDINPTNRSTLEELVRFGWLSPLIHAGARIHQSGCMGCIGMGQAPASGQISLRTMPRNFPGRSGTRDDKVYLCSPETAIASAIAGEITDPRDLAERFDMSYPRYEEPAERVINDDMLVMPPENTEEVELIKGSNISTLPEFEELPDEITMPVLLKVGDDISTDEILPGGDRVLPFRSNIPKISEFTFWQIDETFHDRAKEALEKHGGHFVVGGRNYGQGSSREHAALSPRYLGTKAVIVKDFARIHWENLANFGVLALTFADEADYDDIEQGDVLSLTGLREAVRSGDELEVTNTTKDKTFRVGHSLSPRQVDMVLAGGLVPVYKERLKNQ